MQAAELLAEYIAGPTKLRAAVRGLTPDEYDARPIPGKWSTRQVICHLADAEILYADRIKRVLAEDEPKLMAMNPDQFVASLHYDARDPEDELLVIESVRQQISAILERTPHELYQRRGLHSEAGPLTLEQLLRNVTNHLPHHIAFIAEKRAALDAAS